MKRINNILNMILVITLAVIIINPVIGISVHGKQNKEYSEELLFLTEEEISDLEKCYQKTVVWVNLVKEQGITDF